MKNRLRIPALLILLMVGSLLTGCVASAPAVVTGPPRPYYDSYYRTAPRYYRPARVVVRPAPVIVRPRPVIVRPAPRYYHARPYRGRIRY
ncbi:hypothetical protein [Hymenobacter canadensis]|uniref:Lipoprotein n=1 Tax=Hymenobacter canadensis TaxID=2999067 RepID=A0ABY7LMZ6_9BACT|nr:hypothetical protein [Hymenobacter canadensis]WBA41825.1 hypothetical protein O3303_18700 [Hymenobacter canadensis]